MIFKSQIDYKCRLTRGLGSKSWVKTYLINTAMCAGRDFSNSMSWKGPSI